MAPPPEYDKEPKAPDKCALITTADDPPYLQHNDHPIHPDIKSSTPANNVESEDNKDVEALDDGQLRALLDEAITYKCPKDREGKSSLFKELLEEVEQDEQACEAAARTRRGAGASNSLQDLVAALAAEPAPRRHRPAPRDHAPVSARAHHGGSLPSGVDTSFLLGEEPPRVGGYVATVRCVNPSPLTERRVSTSDAHPPLDDPPHSRSKMAAFPMTYTARATLEIGSGGVAPGRAVTTTTASNQKHEVLRSLESAEEPDCGQTSLNRSQSYLPRELTISFNTSTNGASPVEGPNHVPYPKKEPHFQEVEMRDLKMSEPESLIVDNNRNHSVDRTNNAPFFASQQQLLKTLEYAEDANNNTTDKESDASKLKVEEDRNSCRSVTIDMEGIEKPEDNHEETNDNIEEIIRKPDIESDLLLEDVIGQGGSLVAAERDAALARRPRGLPRADHYVLAELPNNAYVFLTFPKPHALTSNPDNNNTQRKPVQTKNKELHRETKNKKSLREMLLETLMKDGGASSSNEKPTVKVDSGIPFSCITTPEVVTNCNTTSSTQPSAVAVDPKPRAAGPAAPAAADEHRKSLDENGNSVQGASSPPSSQPKKVRRKKTTKNETVINPQEIDGYQGNKDLNEVLRFIESNAEHGRSKLPRTKHRDDADDKGKKRRKDKERGKRASSLEERSRTTLASLTDPAPPAPPAAPERRSWGDDAFYYQPAPAPAPLTPNKDKKKTKPGVDQTVIQDPPVETALELLDFQTVTKKKKQRRRTEESVGAGAGGARAASPGRRRTAPPSDKSNDSNDDLDSVHSAPDAAEPAPDAAPRGASYADIARTRHNIPDLIESCNYYTDGEAPPPAPAYDAESYPALAGGGRAARGAAGGGRGKPALAPPAATPAAPAPDVVTADRPPVILLDEAAPRDMDGVTFGFDVNEQLLAGARRRCDLVAAAEPTAPPAAPAPPADPAPGAVRVTPSLRYRPPPAPAATAALRPIVDYVGNAWEDIMKCGGGKVRYFAE